jgi:hypothetical protein
MKAHVDSSALKRTRWYEYAVRFAFGGLITVATGVIAKKYGPGVGGLFLAFPAIFPATATLIEKHEKQKKNSAGVAGKQRARAAAGVDAAGTAMDCMGLAAFGVMAWKLLPHEAEWLGLAGATLAWLGVSVLTWLGCEQLRVLRRWRAHDHKARRKTAATLSGR